MNNRVRRMGMYHPDKETADWYREDARRRTLERQRRKADWLRDIKRGLSCAHCGLSFADCPECLDFHHVDPAQKDAGVMSGRNRTKRWVLDEIAKCIPLCANCHRRHHVREAPPLKPLERVDPVTPTGKTRRRRVVSDVPV